MKANIRRSLSLLILTGLVLQTAACNGGTTPPSESTSEAENEFPTLPEDLRIDGETIHILYHGRDNYADYDLIGTENSGDVVFDAVYSRNAKVGERLGVSFDFHSRSVRMVGGEYLLHPDDSLGSRGDRPHLDVGPHARLNRTQRQLPRPHRRGISRLQSAVVELFRDEGNVA